MTMKTSTKLQSIISVAESSYPVSQKRDEMETSLPPTLRADRYTLPVCLSATVDQHHGGLASQDSLPTSVNQLPSPLRGPCWLVEGPLFPTVNLFFLNFFFFFKQLFRFDINKKQTMYTMYMGLILKTFSIQQRFSKQPYYNVICM